MMFQGVDEMDVKAAFILATTAVPVATISPSYLMYSHVIIIFFSFLLLRSS